MKAIQLTVLCVATKLPKLSLPLVHQDQHLSLWHQIEQRRQQTHAAHAELARLRRRCADTEKLSSQVSSSRQRFDSASAYRTRTQLGARTRRRRWRRRSSSPAR
jgi:hypothetical protein